MAAWLKQLVVPLALFLGLSQLVVAHIFEEVCSALASKVDLPDVHVQFAEYVPAGTNLTFPYDDPTCISRSQVVEVDLCRLGLQIDTSNASVTVLEAWLPQNWTGRFLSAGNGALEGCIQYFDLAYAAGLGFAAVAGNRGHNGTSGRPFLNAPEVLEDFAYRSLHTGVVVGKQVTQIFYEQSHTKSYFIGCSAGGAQGYMSALMYPEDFDGIVAGAPALDAINLASWTLWLGVITGFDTSSSAFVSPNLWAIVHAEILKQCDGLDGAIDGIIEDPDLCRPYFETLGCNNSTANTSICLNVEQASRVQRVFEPLYSRNGTLLYPRMQPGSELDAYPLYYSGTPFPPSSDVYKYVIYNDPDFDPTSVTLADFEYARALDPYNISAWNGDLSSFRCTGGKLLVYHGLQDQAVSSDNSARYYQCLSETMNLPPSDLDDFYRYFRIGGMAHCRGGPGAWNIGAFATAGTILATPTDPESNVLTAVVAWVEEGKAPEYVRGSKFVDDNPSKGLAFSRRHCKYPARNVYVGPANYTDENAWECQLGAETDHYKNDDVRPSLVV